MNVYVALLRGINVGGHNRVPMAELRAGCAGLGWRDVQSYIASGNLVFRAEGAKSALTGQLAGLLARDFGVTNPVLILPGTAMLAARDTCPFDLSVGKQAHAFFCLDPPAIDHVALADLIANGERLAVQGRIVWLLTPDGLSKSRLAEKLLKVVTGTDMTARNLNTVVKLAAMVEGT